MIYLVTGIGRPFLTNWFDAENHFGNMMVVYDLENLKYTVDGKTWLKLTEDSL